MYIDSINTFKTQVEPASNPHLIEARLRKFRRTMKFRKASFKLRMANLRIADIERLINRRFQLHGRTDDDECYFDAALPHLLDKEDLCGWEGYVVGWASDWTPDVLLDEEAWSAKITAARATREYLSRTEIGRALGLRAEEVQTFRLGTSLGPIDRPAMTKEERRVWDRDRQRRRRVAAGATPRDQSLSSTQPWVAEGISRATYYRRRSRETNSSKAIS